MTSEWPYEWQLVWPGCRKMAEESGYVLTEQEFEQYMLELGPIKLGDRLYERLRERFSVEPMARFQEDWAGWR